MIELVAGVSAAGLVGAHYALPIALKRAGRARLAQRARGSVVLTYDDGPSPGTTPAVLDLLGTRGAVATFFVKGCAVAGNEAVLDRARAQGHEIASHSQDHLHAWKTGPLAQRRDLARGVKTTIRWTDNPVLIRPPYGKWTLPACVWMAARGSRAAWWTADSGDTHEPTPSSDHAAGLVDKHGGGVVLMHDFDQSSEHRRFVLDATTAVLDVADRRGLAVVTMRTLYRAPGDAA